MTKAANDIEKVLRTFYLSLAHTQTHTHTRTHTHHTHTDKSNIPERQKMNGSSV